MDSAAVDANKDPEGRRRPPGILCVAVRAMRVLGAVHALDRAAPVIYVAGHLFRVADGGSGLNFECRFYSDSVPLTRVYNIFYNRSAC